jgi:NADH-quinone oxidoreductase subunit C
MTAPTRLESLAARWRAGGALVVCRHDFKSTGLLLSAVVPGTSLVAMARDLRGDGCTLLDVSGLEAAEGFLVTYHFDSVTEPGRLALRVLAPRDRPRVPSLWPVFQGAEWHERETADFFGLAFLGNPNPVPLLLPDDFDGPPPLRKDPAALAPLSALGLFGAAPEILDPAWGPLTGQAPPPGDAAGPGPAAGQ